MNAGHVQGGVVMNKLVAAVVALGLAVAFTAPAFAAGDMMSAKTKAACTKAGGVWDAKAKKCGSKM
jgi:hypothetical protein